METPPVKRGKVDPNQQAGLYEKAMRMRFNGAKHSEIALAVGRKEQRVRAWFMCGGPLYLRYQTFKKNALELVPGLEIKSTLERIKDEAPKSVDTIVELRDKKKVNPAVRLMSAKDILDRAGFAPIQKTANIHYVEEMTGDELNRTFQTIVDAAKAKPAVELPKA